MYDSETFEFIGELPIKLLPTESREINEIISIAASEDDKQVAVISGKYLVGGMQKTNQLFIFQRQEGKKITYKQTSRVVLKDIEVFTKVSTDYYFYEKEADCIIFCKNDQIFTLNYMTNEIKTVYWFQNQLGR
jgi:hypothetical protein